MSDSPVFPLPVPTRVLRDGESRFLEIEGVHIYSGEEWLALAPNRMQDYARLRLIQAGKEFAKNLGLTIKDEAAMKLEIDEITGKVYVRCIQWMDVTGINEIQ